MARTIKDIFDSMILEKESTAVLNSLQPNVSSFQSLMNDLTSTSKVAVWRLIFFVTAVAIWTVEKLFDEHKLWIDIRAKQIRVATTFWFQQKSLEFQYGDALVFNGQEYVYPIKDLSHQIVQLSSVTELSNAVLIKVAKLNGVSPEPLTSTELDALVAYMNFIKVAGLKVLVVSRPADLLQVYYRVYVDPMVINVTGELISNPSIKPVEDVINNYIKNLPFNGVFSITALTDEIQKIEGVINPISEGISSQYGTQPYQPVGDFYTPNAGWMEVDASYPLTSTIHYLI